MCLLHKSGSRAETGGCCGCCGVVTEPILFASLPLYYCEVIVLVVYGADTTHVPVIPCASLLSTSSTIA